MDRRESAVMPTTGKSDLEFAGQALIEGIPQQMIGHRLGMRCNVEHLSLAHASQMAPRHIPDGVGAGFTCRQTHFGQSSHDGWDILQFGEMQLDALSGRYVTNAGGIPL